MKAVRTDSDHRIFFLDNLRYFLVLLVVLFHSLTSYTNICEWWPVNDDNFLFFDSLLLFLDVFMMPGLFFIAGFFALHTHEGRTTWEFIKRKFYRLVIPLLIGVIFLNPLQMYIWKLSHGQNDINFWHCFLFRIKSALSLYTGLVTLSPEFNQFSFFHFWFISLLFIFFVLFAFTKKIKNAVFSKSSVPPESEIFSSFRMLSVIFSAVFLVFFLNMYIYTIFPAVTVPNTWIFIGNVIQFQPSRLTLYGICFSLGIYAYHKNWFSNNKLPGHTVFWIVLSGVLWFCLHKITFILLQKTSQNLAVLYVFLYPLFFFSMLLTLISVGVNYWNSASKTNRILADNSYNIYLLHLAFIYLFQLVLLNLTAVPIYIKAVVVFIFSVGLSLLISHHAINKSPQLSVAGITIGFILMTAILK